jgi:hypothetical protein
MPDPIAPNTFTSYDSRLLHSIGVTLEPETMQPTDWMRQCAELRQERDCAITDCKVLARVAGTERRRCLKLYWVIGALALVAAVEGVWLWWR